MAKDNSKVAATGRQRDALPAEGQDTPIRFKFPRIEGSDQLRELVHDFGGSQLVCKHLRIAPDLLAKYMEGELDPPYTVLLAVYWHGSYGKSQGFSESHWTHTYNYRRRVDAEQKVERYQAFLGRVAREGLLDADRCMLLAQDAGIDDAWPDEPKPTWLAIADETAAAAADAEREQRRQQRTGGVRRQRLAARTSWQAAQTKERETEPSTGAHPASPPPGGMRGVGARTRSRNKFPSAVIAEEATCDA